MGWKLPATKAVLPQPATSSQGKEDKEDIASTE